ncbi:unnamed protein product [Amoebophrya sp. A120]|nr:unnamed protein product [Amoebophrya sp. A120]|eukprot:GSA120T00011176001.1
MAAASTSSSSAPTRSNAAEMEDIANGTRQDGAPREPTVPDLLISYKGKYQDWIDKVKEVSYRNMEISCATRVLDAQINLWQFFATRPVARERKKSLPGDVRRVIRAFLGQAGPSETTGALGAEVATETARATDRLRAIQYYEGLILAAARRGAEEFIITEEIAEAAPVDKEGDSIDPQIVACYLDRKGYKALDAEGNEISTEKISRFRNVDMPLPYTVSWEAGFYCGPWACTEDQLDYIDAVREGKPIVGWRHADASSKDWKQSAEIESLSSFEKCFIKAIETAAAKAHKAICDLALKTFSEGKGECVVDEEVWETVSSECLLSEQRRPPLFKRDVKRFALTNKDKFADLVPSVAERLSSKTPGLLALFQEQERDPNLEEAAWIRLRQRGEVEPRLPIRLRPRLDSSSALRDATLHGGMRNRI